MPSHQSETPESPMRRILLNQKEIMYALAHLSDNRVIIKELEKACRATERTTGIEDSDDD